MPGPYTCPCCGQTWGRAALAAWCDHQRPSSSDRVLVVRLLVDLARARGTTARIEAIRAGAPPQVIDTVRSM